MKAFNDDKPYDQFVLEQTAGDELVPYRDDNLIALEAAPARSRRGARIA